MTTLFSLNLQRKLSAKAPSNFARKMKNLKNITLIPKVHKRNQKQARVARKN